MLENGIPAFTGISAWKWKDIFEAKKYIRIVERTTDWEDLYGKAV